MNNLFDKDSAHLGISPSPTAVPPIENEPRAMDTPAATGASIPASDQISMDTFRALTGMPPVNADGRKPGTIGTAFGLATGLSVIGDAESNIGLWRRVCQEELQTRLRYHIYNGVVVVSLIAQLILSALFIILGALPHDYHIPIAVLGAVNGVLTGILALMKNQGLPERYRRYEDALRSVRQDAERLERELVTGTLSVSRQEVFALFDKYTRGQKEAQMNRPDVWSTATDFQPTPASHGKGGPAPATAPTPAAATATATAPSAPAVPVTTVVAPAAGP
ncbi:MAG: hypothetical protein M1826_007282 [Phylliscum demangeonii]|nr:MAG: hypothetical protein M1826_007282 [Phylliscum demangeonii]